MTTARSPTTSSSTSAQCPKRNASKCSRSATKKTPALRAVRRQNAGPWTRLPSRQVPARLFRLLLPLQLHRLLRVRPLLPRRPRPEVPVLDSCLRWGLRLGSSLPWEFCCSGPDPLAERSRDSISGSCISSSKGPIEQSCFPLFSWSFYECVGVVVVHASIFGYYRRGNCVRRRRVFLGR